MSTLKKQEPVGLGLRRLACSQVEAAIRCLTRQPGQAGRAIDSIRAAQGLLMLLEADLPRQDVRRDRAIFERLSQGLREMTRPSELLERLTARHKKTPSDAPLATAVKTLRKRWSGQAHSGVAMNKGAGSFNPAIYRLVADMAELRGHIGAWAIDAVANDAPPRGLRRSYTTARRLASQTTSPRALDELIATLGVLEHQLAALSKANPPMLKAQRKLLGRAVEGFKLIDLDDALDRAIRAEMGQSPSKSQRDAKALSPSAAGDLSNALAESPAAFYNRINVYWSVWYRASA